MSNIRQLPCVTLGHIKTLTLWDYWKNWKGLFLCSLWALYLVDSCGFTGMPPSFSKHFLTFSWEVTPLSFIQFGVIVNQVPCPSLANKWTLNPPT